MKTFFPPKQKNDKTMASGDIIPLDTGSEQEKNAPKLTALIEDATEDLKNVSLPGVVGKFFNPLREEVLVPLATKTTEELLPNIPLWSPLDTVGSKVVALPIEATKLGFSILGLHQDVKKEVTESIDREIDALLFEESLLIEEGDGPDSNVLSSLMGVLGFVGNTALDIATLGRNGKLHRWVCAFTKVMLYIALKSDIMKDAVKAFANPRAGVNVLLIARVQEKANESKEIKKTRRGRTAIHGIPCGIDKNIFKEDVCKNIVKDAMRYARYATAAYGTAMISSAELLQVFGSKVEIPALEKDSKAMRQRSIAKYVGVKKDDISSLTPPGGNMKVLGHFISVDHRQRSLGTGKQSKGAVVLAIRGTFTISGLLIDAQAYSTKFCGGVAHAGIANSADTLWNTVKEEIVKLLRRYPGYDLVITGHSLGAGCAALLALKLMYDDVLAKMDSSLQAVQVNCFAFAPPPVYYQDVKDERITDSMAKIYSFIHENDCVPFLSVDAIRRLLDTVLDVDKFATLPFAKPLMAAGLIGVPDDLKNTIIQERSLEPVKGGQPLAIPSKFLMWMQYFRDDEKDRPMYDFQFCRPEKENGHIGTNDLNILLDEDMISDHMPPNYERAINSIGEQMIGGKNG